MIPRRSLANPLHRGIQRRPGLLISGLDRQRSLSLARLRRRRRPSRHVGMNLQDIQLQ
jgi:hypothetical protein